MRQLFIWDFANGLGGAAGAKATRIALYNKWNSVNKRSVGSYW